MNEDAELIAVFEAEVSEQLDALDEHLARGPGAYRYDDLFHLAHNVKGAARMVGAPGLTEAAHALEDLFDVMRGGRPSTEETTLLMREGASWLRRCFDALGGGESPDVSSYVRKVAEALSIDVSRSAELEPKVNTSEARASVNPASDDAASRERPSADGAGAGTIRIAVDKLERLMGLSAEFATTVHRTDAQRASVGRILELAERLGRSSRAAKKNPDLLELIETAKELRRTSDDESSQGTRVAEELQSAIRRLRMIRMDTLSALLGRVARGAAEAHGREVRFEMLGGETEIDRTILDRLRDPLVHLVRNAIAHGLEAPEVRAQAGKPRTGTVTLRAESAGSWVEIVISDDGRGVDDERVRRRAVALGIIDDRQAEAMLPEEATELIFHPGLSTALQVSELAGRGFGMDIVRANLVELGGSVTVSSARGRGTEMRMRAPLTLLTTRALVAIVAGQTVAVPMMNAERALTVERSTIRVVDGREVIRVEDRLLPIASLAVELGLGQRPFETTAALVLAEGHRRCAFIVDEILGEKELTMQPLGWNLPHVRGIAGGAVVESGEVVLVLHAHELVGAKTQTVTGQSPLLDRQVADAKRRVRVLLVDDSVTSRTLQRNILASAGYDVRTANDGLAALESLREHPAEIVVSDVEMPRMTGIELTTRLRASQEFNRLPIILVTSLGSISDRDRGAAAGADAYIVKGEFDQDELLRAVARLV